MLKTINEHIGKVFNFLNLDKDEDFSEFAAKNGLLIPFAQTRVSGFNMMIIGSRPSNGRTLFLNELLIANTIYRPTNNIFDVPEPSRSLAYFLTEKPRNYFNNLIPCILGINKETLWWNNHFRVSADFQCGIHDLDAILSRRPLFLEFSLPSGKDEFIKTIESDIKLCNPDFIFIDGLEALAQPEKLQFDLYGTRNIDSWLDACLELNIKHSIPFVITRLLIPNACRSYNFTPPAFFDFNSSTIDSTCDIVVSMVRPALNEINDESERNNLEKMVQFLVHRDRTGSLSGQYQCKIENEIPKLIFPGKNYI